MVGSIRGTVIHKALSHIISECNGVGYKLFVTTETLSSLREGQETHLWTHLVVRENALDLFGFDSQEELIFFELLIGISGVGPKSALNILSLASVETLSNAISSGDTSYLTKVSGIGKKSAQKIVLELKDKLGAVFAGSEESANILKEDIDVLEALKALGYSQVEARNILQDLPSDVTGTNDRIKEALKLLGQ